MPAQIRNREQARQLTLFHGLRFDTISPTNVDAFVEFGGRLFVFVETKREGAALPVGQLIALKRLCDACQSESREAIVVLTRHDTQGDIDLALTRVEKFWHRGRWHRTNGDWTLRELLDLFHERYVTR